jgi:hypothetical protein
VFEVSLGEQAFEVKDAVFFSLQHALAPPTTLVVFGDQPGLCQRVGDARNVCNARVAPDVHGGFVNALSRPIGVTRPLGWLVMRSATEGAALVAPDGLGLGTPGASLTEGAHAALHARKNRVVIEQLVAGDVGAFSFQSALSDGRALARARRGDLVPRPRHGESVQQPHAACGDQRRHRRRRHAEDDGVARAGRVSGRVHREPLPRLVVGRHLHLRAGWGHHEVRGPRRARQGHLLVLRPSLR